MERKNVESSHILSIGYDENSKILEVEFKGKKVYQYKQVPKGVYENLMNSDSHGTFLSAYIRDKYPTIKIN